MKILLVALNAKFIHSSLALRYLKKYAASVEEHVSIEEYTINHRTDFILADIFEKQPDVVGFSCYIWNIEMILTIAENLKKVLPKVHIFFGGPEVSYDAEERMKEYPFIDFIIRGEGEETFQEVAEGFVHNAFRIENIQGVTYRKDGMIFSNADRKPIEMDSLPFVYEELSSLEHRILYYETQRGCPYCCQYCLSSIEKGIRFLSLERVEKDLQFFLNQQVRQVKFVDRTFNANPAHAKHIWAYLIAHDNGITNFHMEITADIMDQESLDLLKKARPGLFQFEIGVQTTNPKTMTAIQRNVNFDKLSAVVKEIKRQGNIHQHLDLIAGLPEEDYTSFGKSFDDVYALQPEQFQLGFLKLLKGSGLRRDAKLYDIVYQSKAVYEVLSTHVLPYADLLKLKAVEEMVELYYNSGKALHTLAFGVALYDSPFRFYEALGTYWKKKGHDLVQHSKMELYTILYQFIEQDACLSPRVELFRDLLKLDIFTCDFVKTLPDWLQEEGEEAKEKRWNFWNHQAWVEKTVPHLSHLSSKQLSKCTYIGFFSYAVLDFSEEGISNKKATAYLFDYTQKDSFWGHASVYGIQEEMFGK